MKTQVSQPDYGPKEWDFDFSFDLDLSFSDYLFLGLYLIFIVPIAFISGLAQSLFCKVKDSLQAESECSVRQWPSFRSIRRDCARSSTVASLAPALSSAA